MNKTIFIKNWFDINSNYTNSRNNSSIIFFIYVNSKCTTESYEKDVRVTSLNCNNINVNVNGLKPEVSPPSLSTLLTNGEIDDALYSYESNSRNYDSETSGPENDLRYICINNNNNTVIEEELIPLTPPEPPTPFINSKENKFLVVIIFQVQLQWSVMIYKLIL